MSRTAQALLCDEERRFALAPVELPDPGDHQILVRTLVSGVSIGTEFALLRGDLDWGPFPLCTGYQAVGEVAEVGAAVRGYAVGDCVYFRDNKVIARPDGAPVSAISGTHCSLAVIDPATTHGLAHLPAGCDLEAAALFVMPAVGLTGVDLAGPRLGESVVVQGAGLIGLGVIAACVLRGCRVLAIDPAPECRALAAALGARVTVDPAAEDVGAAVEAFAPGGARTVFEATGRPALLDAAVALAQPEGTLVLQGNYGAAPLPFAFLPAHGRRLTWRFPCDDGGPAARAAVLDLMARGALPWARVITHRLTPAEAPAVYTRLLTGRVPGLVGAVINWAA